MARCTLPPWGNRLSSWLVTQPWPGIRSTDGSMTRARSGSSARPGCSASGCRRRCRRSARRGCDDRCRSARSSAGLRTRIRSSSARIPKRRSQAIDQGATMVTIKTANAQFWVHDQDEALDFYTTKLGWEVRADVTMEASSFRWLCVAPPGADGPALVLMPVPGQPMLDEASSAQLSDLVAKGAGGTLFLETATPRPPMTSCPPEVSSSTTRRRCSRMESTRPYATPRATTSGSHKYWNSIRNATDRTPQRGRPGRTPPVGRDIRDTFRGTPLVEVHDVRGRRHS